MKSITNMDVDRRMDGWITRTDGDAHDSQININE